MTKDLYQENNQRIYMVDEHSYGEHYDPQTEHAAWTAISATFPHIIPVDVLKDGLDYEIPIIIKEKIYGIGGGKYPVLIANKRQEPVEFTLDCEGQTALFAAYAIGSTASTKGGAGAAFKEVTEITCPAESGNIVQGDYFLINGIDANGEEHFAVWMDTAGDGNTGKPTIAGIAADHVLAANLSGSTPNSTATQVATAVKTILDADAAFGATSVAGVVTVTNALEGAVRDARDSGVGPTNCTFDIGTQGCSKHIVTENTGHKLSSFTLHIEQRNDDSDEDIIVDLFGCVVQSYSLSIDFDEALFKESVTIKCPHYAEGDRLTNPPHIVHNFDIWSWANMKEAISTYLLMEGSTEKTPKIVTKINLEIGNTLELFGEIGYDYCQYVIAKERTVSLNIVGLIDCRDTFDYYKDKWDNINKRYSLASGRLNSKLKVERTATYDYFIISFYNWLLEEHNHRMFPISEGIKGLDITLTEATPDSNRRIIDSFEIYDYLSDTCYHNSWS